MVEVGDKQYCVSGIRTRRTEANKDDSSVYTALVCSGEEV